MTQRRLLIHIDANRVTCGKCEHAFYRNAGKPNEVRCELFGTWFQVGRCAPCLAAERDAAGGGA